MTLRLRGHHLLCLLTYKGEGYTPAFVANFNRIAGRIAAGENFELADGPDDICAPLLTENPCAHCSQERIVRRDRIALQQMQAEGLSFKPGSRHLLKEADLRKMRAAFRAGRIRAACKGCEWHAFCTQVADNNFAETCLSRPSTLPF